MKRQFHSSPRVRTQYLRALAKLSERLNETWNQVFPPDALWPHETCEAFFEPFAQLGVALYDAYAQELLNSTPSQEHYIQALNFDLKTLVCNQICPNPEKPIRTLQDALDADARGEPSDEWTNHMTEAWRLFEHPRHSTANNKVCHEFIDIYDHLPELWKRLFERTHSAISRRVPHWMAAHAERELALVAAARSVSPDPGSPNPTPQLINRKRGRPQTISDERKAAASALKARGGTNRDAAAVIYEKKYPTPQETKNVSAILRNYRRKAESPLSSVHSGKPSPNPRKNRG
jgi:hypothetical protein